MNKNKMIGAVIVVIVLLGIVAYFGTRPTSAPMDMGASTAVTDGGTDADTIPPATSPSANVDAFTVSGGNFYFTPKTLTVKKGDTVQITFVNAGGNHDLKIDEFGASTPVIGSGQTSVLTFVADKAGTFEYYCSVGNHRQMGMVGTLTVTE